MSTYLTWSKFHTKEEAAVFTEFLEANTIPFKVEWEAPVMDKVYIGEQPEPFIEVQVPQDKFEAVNELMKKEAVKQLDDVSPDYYLFSFSETELQEVLQKPDEWNYFDQALAAKLLAERFDVHEPVSTAVITEPVFVPYKLSLPLLLLSYLGPVLIPFTFAPMLAGPLMGIFLGAAILTATKTLPTGRQVKLFDNSSRTHARIILTIGIIRLISDLIRLLQLTGHLPYSIPVIPF